MEIKVRGVGEKSFRPDAIKFKFQFSIKRSEYNQCLEDGTKNVENYFNFLKTKGFNKEELKTQSFNIYRETHYNDKTKKYDEGDFVFSFVCELIMDYNLELMAQIMEETSKINECPTYKVDFTLKDEKQAIDELMKLAYKHAEYQANVISKASGKVLKDCVNVSFEPFEGSLSNSYGNMKMMAERCCANSVDSIQNIFVPKDVELSFEVYTLWVAE